MQSRADTFSGTDGIKLALATLKLL